MTARVVFDERVLTQISDVGSIPIARSINPDDSVDLTRLSSLNSTEKWPVLDGVWTVLMSIGRSVFSDILCCLNQTPNELSPVGLAQGRTLDWKAEGWGFDPHRPYQKSC